MAHRWLIGVSVGAHLAIGVGLFASGVWRIERMEPSRFVQGIAVMLPPPVEGGPKPGKKPEDLPKKDDRKRKPPVVTQLATSTETAVTTTTTTDTDTGDRAGDGDPQTSGCQGKDNCVGTAPAIPACGNGAVEIGEQCDDGNTSDGDGCSSTCRTEVRRVDPITVAPTVLRALRVSGETDVHPYIATQYEMRRDGTRNVTSRIRVCVAIDGSVASTTVLHATGYPDYDSQLRAAIRKWRYRPYAVAGTPVPACGIVTFNYSMR